MLLILASLLAFTNAAIAATPPADPLITLAESSGWKKTARYDEAVSLCERFQKAFPGQAKCARFGVTPEGRPMVALVASSDGALTPKAAAAKGRPVVLAQGSIHAGECDGKDAGFFLMRKILRKRELPGVLSKVTFVFVPVFNIDGHERFGAYHRPNQNGPEEMGWRVTGRNLNLNRDYVKADAPEMQAMLKFLDDWDPILYADLHVTDGADFQHQIALVTHPFHDGPRELTALTNRLVQEMMARLEAQKHLPLPFYPDFRKMDDPTTGFETGIAPPRFSEAYWELHNRIGMLVETHSWKDYATRVRATADALRGILELAARDGREWMKAARKADLEAGGDLAGKDVALAYDVSEKSHPVTFQGYAYKREKSEISGDTMVTYDPSEPVTYQLPLFDEIRPKLTVRAPRRGYLVPPAHASWVEAKLKLHGLRYEVVKSGSVEEVETFRSTEPEFGPRSYENRQTLKVKSEWKPERREVMAGSLFVPIHQPRARLAMHLLEPMAPDSLAAWGFFNSHFERREYMEPYVAETVAREMLAKDPAVKAEFEQKLKSDAEFAKSADKRLEFFYRKHPSWDERFGLYPIYRR